MLTYIDCGSGIAGDMLLGALIGLGLSSKELEKTLRGAFREKDWGLKVAHVERQMWPAWAVRVEGDRPYGSPEKMRACVRRSKLPPAVKTNAIQIFNRLETAERQAHGHSHGGFDPQGLGLLDTLVDVVGNCWGFWKLNIREAVVSPINTGRVAPATAAMLQKAGTPIYSNNASKELATPTGVAVILQLGAAFKPMPEMRLEKAGYGVGTLDIPGKPNVLAVYQGTVVLPPLKKGGRGDLPLTSTSNPSQPPFFKGRGLEQVLLLQTVIDDMDPRLYPHVMDLLLKNGALDAWWAPIGMKKGRPGIAFTVLCRPEDEKKLLQLLFRETTTLGVRRQPMERWVLPRKLEGLRKTAILPGGRTKVQTEFEVAREIASRRAVPLQKLLK